MAHLLRLTLLALVLMFGCGASAPDAGDSQAGLLVAAAANLKFVFPEIKAEFERKYPSIDLEVTYGSSGNFFAQLSQRAPFDIFLSADTNSPQRLIEEGLAHKDSYFPYAAGRLVLWVSKDSPLEIESQELRVLLDPRVKKISIANPRLAPYGLAAEEALAKYDLYSRVEERLVFGDNITQAAHFVESGAADAGLIALSLARSPKMQSRGKYWEIPARAHHPIEQAGVIPVQCKNPVAAEKLREFLLSERCREILREYGYSAPGETRSL